jgi:hypothetical protein
MAQTDADQPVVADLVAQNTVQYRIHKAEESLGRPVGHNRHNVELALQASHWLGSSVLQPA